MAIPRPINSLARRRFIGGLSLFDLIVASGATIGLIAVAMLWWISTSDIDDRVRAANFLADVHRSQREFFEHHGHYAESIGELDTRVAPPLDHDVHPLRLTSDGWRLSAAPAGALSPAQILVIDQNGWLNLK